MANYQSIDTFINKFNGGFRPNRFRVNGQVGAGEATNIFHIKSASLPASSMTTLQIPYKGRFFKLPGNRIYDTWTITVLDDTPPEGAAGAIGSNLWQSFHNWSEQFNSHVGNEVADGTEYTFGAAVKVNPGSGTDEVGMINWTVEQLDLVGQVTKKITLFNCWPVKVGAIVLNMDNYEELITFPVTLTYQYFEIDLPTPAIF